MQARKIFRLLSNSHNLKVALSVFRRAKNPIAYLKFLVLKRSSSKVTTVTPIDEVDIYLRNLESGRTFFSIFMREDYP